MHGRLCLTSKKQYIQLMWIHKGHFICPLHFSNNIVSIVYKQITVYHLFTCVPINHHNKTIHHIHNQLRPLPPALVYYSSQVLEFLVLRFLHSSQDLIQDKYTRIILYIKKEPLEKVDDHYQMYVSCTKMKIPFFFFFSSTFLALVVVFITIISILLITFVILTYILTKMHVFEITANDHSFD